MPPSGAAKRQVKLDFQKFVAPGSKPVEGAVGTEPPGEKSLRKSDRLTAKDTLQSGENNENDNIQDQTLEDSNNDLIAINSNSEPSASSSRDSKRPGASIESDPKRRKPSAGYAPPSKYAHVDNNLTDTLRPGLICVFIGLNPGLTTATTGHAYAHPSNLFWRLLHSSGCTPRLCLPSETYNLPELYNLGNTNIVARATANGAELSKKEMDDGVAILDEKVRTFQPEVVCIVGKSIWESIWRVWKGRSITKNEFKYGWQADSLRMGKPKRMQGKLFQVEKNVNDNQPNVSSDTSKPGDDSPWKGARVFVATTTSGLAANMSLVEKQAIWKQLGEFVKERRETI